MKDFKLYITKNIGPNLVKQIGTEWQEQNLKHTHICKSRQHNFVDSREPMYCAIKGDIFSGVKIHYHRWAKCLTSSQVMCISFFKKFFEQPQYEVILLKLLRKCGLQIAEEATITNAIFEYEPDPQEKTNFDFYLILSNKQRISFEVKYTEQEFGGISLDKKDSHKYERKWSAIYKQMVEECSHFKGTDIQMQDFYKHYQISRNIVYAKNPDDLVVFLTPKENQSLEDGRSYIDGFATDSIKNLYWEVLISELEQLVLDEYKLQLYFKDFKAKYLDFYIDMM